MLRYLKEHDITLVKAAEATGVAQQNIKKSIGNNPKTSTLLALAKGLGVDPREFFYDLDEKEEEEKNDIQENIEGNMLLESPDVPEEETILRILPNQITRRKQVIRKKHSPQTLRKKAKM